MALTFGNTKGTAQKTTHESYAYVDGEQTVRLIGGVLPRYVYWVKGTKGKDIPLECLAFDREKEKFTNAEQDLVQEYYPDLKCSWAYAVNCIDPKDGKVKVLNLKKKLFLQIQEAAADLGDPTDFDEGWDVVFKKVKTGTAAFNVEYNLQVLRCKKRALTADERAAATAALSIDEKLVRPTVEEIRNTLEKIRNADNGEEAAGTDNEAVNELG